MGWILRLILCFYDGNPQIPKTYKRNDINGDLHRGFKTASNFDAEVSIITKKYLEAGYPIGFIESVICDFQNG